MTDQIPSAEPIARIADRLVQARRARFVGREAEIDLFRSELLAQEPSFAVLHLHGPGGIGKTTLLREYSRLATEAARDIVHIDGRNVEPSPAGLLAALGQALGFAGADVATVVGRWPAAGILLIDTYETLASLDGWLRETLLPRLPARSVIVLAGRNEPDPAWRTDTDWSPLVRLLPLRNLRVEESRTYLAVRGVPEERHREVLAFTHGHPLALSLVAEVLNRGEPLASFRPENAPDVVRALLEKFAEEVPSAEHRAALQVCATVWATTEALLAAVLERSDAREIFEWLSRLSFIEHGPYGVFPHDLARDVLHADCRWRNPDMCRRLNERVLNYLYGRLPQARGLEQQRVWFDLLHVQRYNPAIRPYFEWTAFGTAYAEPSMPADHAEILAMVERHEGATSAGIARYWLERQPEAFIAFRGVDGALLGFLAHLRIEQASDEDAAVDPAIAAARMFMQRHGPVRSGEEAVLLRFWMGREGYQAVSPALTLTATVTSAHWASHPRLAWNFVTMANPDFMEPILADIHVWRSPDADFEVGGRRYGSFTHDWRVEPAPAWLATKAERASRVEPDPEPARAPPPLIVLSQDDFTEAVRDALRDYTRPDKYAANPLLRSRLLARAPAAGSPVETLGALLREAAETLTKNPKDKKLYLAVWHTYLQPAVTQEQAAELLDLPFNTYRYHLAKGTERIAEWLWQRELHDPNV